MSIWNSAFIRTYRALTWPYRQAVLRRQIASRTVPVSILFYHRVANHPVNPWTISEADFLQQIDWLQSHFELVSLSETQRRIKHGNTKPAVSITFDDGYAENCSFALPLLLERKIPVTYFVTTHHTTHNSAFAHDIDRGEPLPPNSIESLRAIANAGIEIGAHTRTHIDLGKKCDDATLFDEVIAATKELESMLGTEIRYFAFPFGQPENLDSRVFQLLHSRGFAGVCSAYGGTNEIFGDEFHLQRLHGDPNIHRIKNWLLGDPRLTRVKRYQWKPARKTVDRTAAGKQSHEQDQPTATT